MTLVDPAELAARFDALPAAVRVRAAVAAGTEEVYLVGGAVRDLWLGGAPRDLDLVVVGEVGPLASRLAAGGAGETPGPGGIAHIRFGTATVRGRQGERYDLAAARRERYPQPGALPELEPAAIREDLARRDFSINALALGLSGTDTGRALGAAHGFRDMVGRTLRVLHAESFRDDPTRLLRLARYAGRLGFAVEPGTESLARAAVARGVLGTVSGPRIGAELELLAGEPDALSAFAVLAALGIDSGIAPGFGICDPAAVRRALELVAIGAPRGSRRGCVVLAGALLGVAPARRRALLDRLGIDRRGRQIVLAAAARAPALATRIPVTGPPSQVWAALGAEERETVALAGGLGSAAVAAAVAGHLAQAAGIRLEITGLDLIDAGVRPGPVMAVALRAALGARLDGEAPTRELQLAAALRAVESAGAGAPAGPEQGLTASP